MIRFRPSIQPWFRRPSSKAPCSWSSRPVHPRRNAKPTTCPLRPRTPWRNKQRRSSRYELPPSSIVSSSLPEGDGCRVSGLDVRRTQFGGKWAATLSLCAEQRLAARAIAARRLDGTGVGVQPLDCMNARKPKPVAVCTRCGTHTHRVEFINERCHQGSGKDRCKGVFGSALSVDDWQQCGACSGTAWVGSASCGNCQASGWLYVRRR